MIVYCDVCMSTCNSLRPRRFSRRPPEPTPPCTYTMFESLFSTVNVKDLTKTGTVVVRVCTCRRRRSGAARRQRPAEIAPGQLAEPADNTHTWVTI